MTLGGVKRKRREAPNPYLPDASEEFLHQFRKSIKGLIKQKPTKEASRKSESPSSRLKTKKLEMNGKADRSDRKSVQDIQLDADNLESLVIPHAEQERRRRAMKRNQRRVQEDFIVLDDDSEEEKVAPTSKKRNSNKRPRADRKNGRVTK